MPKLRRDDGAEIAWRDRGQGPPVVLANIGYAHMDILCGLEHELAGDHRVIAYDPRGVGESSRRGPYEIALDAADLTAVIEDAGVSGAVLLGNGDGANRALRAGAERPDLIATVVLAGNLALRGPGEGESLSDSREVRGALLALLETDYRAGLHAMFGPGNPELDGAALHERVERTVANSEREATVARIRAWIADDPLEPARSLAGRLWILPFQTNPWFTSADRARTLLPAAVEREIEEGPFSRPDLTATVIREITSVRAR